MTQEEYAAHVGASDRTVRRWLDAGKLPAARKVGRAYMIPADSLPLAQRTPDVSANRPVSAIRTPDTGQVTAASGVQVGGPVPILLAVDHVAALFGITTHAVVAMIHAGELAGYRRGPNGAWRVPMAEVRRLAGG
jgi:excisionase family DNA binding protein